MKKPTIGLMCLSILLLSSSAFAKKEKKDETVKNEEGRVRIVWQSPNKYRDIRPSNQSGSRFEKHLFNELDEKFEDLAKDLPKDYTMHLTVTNIDLAGEMFVNGFGGTRLGFGSFGGAATELRVIDRTYIPRITFSYQIVDENGAEITAGDENVKDLGFLDRRRAFATERPFVYEKRMIARWYETTIQPQFSDTLAKR